MGCEPYLLLLVMRTMNFVLFAQEVVVAMEEVKRRFSAETAL